MLSLVVIARDEADRIAACLASVPFAGECVVLDSGSTDGTPEIAERLGARVIRTDWPGHIAQKNRALDEANGEWILSLDADERLSDAARGEVQDVLQQPGDASGFSFPRLSDWLGTPIRHGRWYPDRKVRLVRRGAGRWGGRDPHDRMEVRGRVRRLSGEILHFPYRSLSEHLETIDRYASVQAAAMARDGVCARWWDVYLRPPAHFVDAYLLRRGFLDGAPGAAVAGLGAWYVYEKWRQTRRIQSGGTRRGVRG